MWTPGKPAGAPGAVVEPVRRRSQNKCLDKRGYAFARIFCRSRNNWLLRVQGSPCCAAEGRDIRWFVWLRYRRGNVWATAEWSDVHTGVEAFLECPMFDLTARSRR